VVNAGVRIVPLHDLDGRGRRTTVLLPLRI
jgi:hypothetical protein